MGQKHKILLSTPPPFPPGGVTPTQPSVFKKKLAVTNGCVGVIVLSKSLGRMALPGKVQPLTLLYTIFQ